MADVSSSCIAHRTTPVAGGVPVIPLSGRVSFWSHWSAVAPTFGDRLALASPGQQLTFAEVDAQSRQVASALAASEPGDQRPIGVLVRQDARGLVAMLGASRTGRPVVLLDPHMPPDRLGSVVRLAGLDTCVVDDSGRALSEQLDLRSRPALEDLLRRPVPGPEPLPPGDPSPQDVFCLIFTSGSTGTPKAVQVTHGQLLHSARSLSHDLGMLAEDSVALLFHASFMAGCASLAAALLTGVPVHAWDAREQGTTDLAAYLDEHRVTYWFSTPYLMRAVLPALEVGRRLATVRTVVTAGEPIHGRDIEAARPHLPADARFVNSMGTSETGAMATQIVAADDPLPDGPVPAGTPTPWTTIRLLGEDAQPVAVGRSGEIVVVSDHLSAGYLPGTGDNDRFAVGPDGERSYRTGDLGRLDGNGVLHLLGRMDQAVKIRGYLVEPAEVETALLRLPDVAEAAVSPLKVPGRPTGLVAHISPQPGHRVPSAAAVRRRLREVLPEYMVPSEVVVMRRLPRNERGKVDRGALPQPVIGGRSPVLHDPMQRVIADLWAELLGVSEIGEQDDFMALGGDSLLVEEMLTRAEERFGVPLRSADLHQGPTLREFAARVQAQDRALPRHATAVTLRPQGPNRGPAIFCFAGAGGLALSFQPLAARLTDRAVYAFQAHGLEARGLPDWTVRAAARRHLATLRLLQPSGPYILVGHSFGGLVALEIARLLRAGSEQVELLVLVDTYLPRHLREAAVAGPVAADLLSGQAVGPEQGRRAWHKVAETLARSLPRSLPPARQWTARALAPLAGVVQFSGTRQFDVFLYLTEQLIRFHELHSYDGPTLRVSAAGNPDPDAAWDTILVGPTQTAQIPCEHVSVLREPYVQELAEVLQSALAQRAERALSLT